MEKEPAAAPEISFVLPVLNESDGLSDFIEELGRFATDSLGLDESCYEIILVDDGSSDASWECICSLASAHAGRTGLRLSRHFGKEAALLAGMSAASGQAVITLDADGQHPLASLVKFIAAWRDGDDIVHGVKDRKSQRVRLGARLFNHLFSRMTGIDLVGASDFKLLDRRVVDILLQQFPERVRFHRGLAQWLGFRQRKIEFTPVVRLHGQTRWSFFSLLRYAFDSLSAYTHLPLKFVPLLGMLMFVVSLALGGEALVSRLRGEAVSGFATLEMTILFVGSVMMMGMGVIGLYLARMFDEIKHRPVYLISDRTDRR